MIVCRKFIWEWSNTFSCQRFCTVINIAKGFLNDTTRSYLLTFAETQKTQCLTLNNPTIGGTINGFIPGKHGGLTRALSLWRETFMRESRVYDNAGKRGPMGGWASLPLSGQVPGVWAKHHRVRQFCASLLWSCISTYTFIHRKYSNMNVKKCQISKELKCPSIISRNQYFIQV